jgi:hypothetical protein
MDNIKMDIEGIGLKGVVWIRLLEYRDKWPAVVNAIMSFKDP